jgi:hypothetical protein
MAQHAEEFMRLNWAEAGADDQCVSSNIPYVREFAHRANHDGSRGYRGRRQQDGFRDAKGDKAGSGAEGSGSAKDGCACHACRSCDDEDTSGLPFVEVELGALEQGGDELIGD